MRQRRVFGALLLALFVVGCGGGSAKDKLVGKWSAKEKVMGDKEIEIVTEFTKDGKVIAEITGLGKKEGTYKVIDDKTLEVTMKGPDEKDKTEKGPFKIEGDKLTLTDDKGKDTVMTRVK
jgi:uncharacterized protein (TIGR03066 family)